MNLHIKCPELWEDKYCQSDSHKAELEESGLSYKYEDKVYSTIFETKIVYSNPFSEIADNSGYNGDLEDHGLFDVSDYQSYRTQAQIYSDVLSQGDL